MNLYNAYFDGNLSPERGTHCAVGTMLFDALGCRVAKESWMPILASHRFNTQLSDNLTPLRNQILEHMSIEYLSSVDYAFHVDTDMLDRIRRVDKLNEHVLV